MKKHILLTLFILVQLTTKAQIPIGCPPGQEAVENCGGACVFCNIHGYSGSTEPYLPGNQQGFCGINNNDQWFGFIASASSATFTAMPSNCFWGQGLQMGIWDDCSSNPIDCDNGMFGGGNSPAQLVNVPLTPGTVYYLIIDGSDGDLCDFTITVDPPSATIAPPLGDDIGPIQGPDMLCPGAEVMYTIPQVPYASSYTWTAPHWVAHRWPAFTTENLGLQR